MHDIWKEMMEWWNVCECERVTMDDLSKAEEKQKRERPYLMESALTRPI